MRKSFATIALVAALASTAGACAGGTSTLTQTDLAKKLQDTGKLQKAFADCVAAEVFPKLTKKEKDDFNSATLSQDLQNSLVKKAGTAGDACRAKGVTP